MKIFNLPYDLTSTHDDDNSSVIIRRYRSEQSTVKSKIILHQNMINLLISGKKTIIRKDDVTTIHEGEFLILSSGNCLTSEVLSDDDKSFSSIILYFSNAILTDFFIKYRHLIPSQKQSDKKPFLVYQQDSFIVNYIQTLGIMLQLPSGFSADLRKIKLEELLVYLLHHDALKLHSLLMVSSDDQDMQLRKAVETNIGNQVTVEELAFLCNASVSTFKRRFNKIYGTSPQKWLLEKKIQLAADLLKHVDEKPGMVFEKVGYENHSSFTHAFKQYYGITPTQYHEHHCVSFPYN